MDGLRQRQVTGNEQSTEMPEAEKLGDNIGQLFDSSRVKTTRKSTRAEKNPKERV